MLLGVPSRKPPDTAPRLTGFPASTGSGRTYNTSGPAATRQWQCFLIVP